MEIVKYIIVWKITHLVKRHLLQQKKLEKKCSGTFLTETKQHGNARDTEEDSITHKPKYACAKLKHWIETEKLEVASKLLRELKHSVRGNSYPQRMVRMMTW